MIEKFIVIGIFYVASLLLAGLWAFMAGKEVAMEEARLLEESRREALLAYESDYAG